MVDLHKFQGLDDGIVVDTSEGRTAYLLIDPHNRHIRLSPSAYQLLKSIYEGQSFAAVAEQLSKIQQRTVCPEEVETAYQRIMTRVTAIGGHPRDQIPGFWLRVPLVPSTLVGRIARPLSKVFGWAALPLLLGGLALIGLSLARFGFTLSLSPEVFWSAYGLFLISLVAHEFGHASACAHYGVQPHTIGFAIYWIYPVFYSDVSTAWQLRRWQRVVVDLSGVLFQSGIGAVYGMIYLFWRWEPAYIALLMIVYSCVFSLNPILRFDGYWVLADALGVTNLGKQSRRVFQYIVDQVRGRPTRPLPWPKHIMISMFVYMSVSFVFWGYFTWQLIPFVWRTWSTYPSTFVILVDTLLTAPHQITSNMVQAFLASTFTTLITVIMVFRLAQSATKPLIAIARQLIQRTPDVARVRS